MSRKSRSRRRHGARDPDHRETIVQSSAPRWILWLIPALIALVTFAAFEPTLRNQFITGWDDDRNLLGNPHYRGLAAPQLRWMFSTFHVGHYMPLTGMTLGLDYVLWGMQPAGSARGRATRSTPSPRERVGVRVAQRSLPRNHPSDLIEPSASFHSGLSSGVTLTPTESVCWAAPRITPRSGLTSP